jgi:hypothetical protein
VSTGRGSVDTFTLSTPMPPKVTFVIEFDPATGNVNVTGDLANRLLAYGLLEFAKEIILRQALAPQNESRIVVPQLVPPKNLSS